MSKLNRALAILTAIKGYISKGILSERRIRVHLTVWEVVDQDTEDMNHLNEWDISDFFTD